MRQTKRHEVRFAGQWIKCTRSRELGNGWLEYALRDGTQGLKRPGEWRERKPTQIRT